MPIPNTGGQLRTKIDDMQIGDYIKANHNIVSSGTIASNVFSLNPEGTTEVPVTGMATGSGIYYLIKVDKGLLVADRVCQHSITWDRLNIDKVMQGMPYNAANIIPVMTSDTAPSGIVSASSNYNNVSIAWQAFDSNDTVGWNTFDNVVTGWLAYEFPENKVVRRYTVKARNDSYFNQTPNTWTFEGWDGTQWVVLDTQVNQVFAQNEEKGYFINDPKSFKKYRINITKNNGGIAVHIATMKMFEEAGIIRSLNGGSNRLDVSSPLPEDNEYSRYMNGSNVWNDDTMYTWTQETPVYGSFASSNSSSRILRNKNAISYAASNTTRSDIGFRPVFQYQEVIS